MKRNIYRLLLLVMFSCVGPMDYLEDLSGDWYYFDEGPHFRIIRNKNSKVGEAFIPCEVVAFDYNKDFIIAQQKYDKHCPMGHHNYNYPLSTDSMFYWIVVHKEKLLLGPLNVKEFNLNRIKFKVSEELELKSGEL